VARLEEAPPEAPLLAELPPSPGAGGSVAPLKELAPEAPLLAELPPEPEAPALEELLPDPAELPAPEELSAPASVVCAATPEEDEPQVVVPKQAQLNPHHRAYRLGCLTKRQKR
jgi:hypothetical protein